MKENNVVFGMDVEIAVLCLETVVPIALFGFAICVQISG